MTNDEKALLKSLVKGGYSADTIACYVNCSMATIKKYIRIFKKRKNKMTNYDILKEYEAHKTPVPSYDEWQQLKELLEEIRDSIAESQLKLTPEGFKLITEIVAKIDEALQ